MTTLRMRVAKQDTIHTIAIRQMRAVTCWSTVAGVSYVTEHDGERAEGISGVKQVQ